MYFFIGALWMLSVDCIVGSLTNNIKVNTNKVVKSVFFNTL